MKGESKELLRVLLVVFCSSSCCVFLVLYLLVVGGCSVSVKTRLLEGKKKIIKIKIKKSY